MFRSTRTGQSNCVKIPPKLAQLISQPMNGSTSVFNTESLLSILERLLWLQAFYCSWVWMDKPCELWLVFGNMHMCTRTHTHVAWYQKWCFGIILLQQMCWYVNISVIFTLLLLLLFLFIVFFCGCCRFLFCLVHSLNWVVCHCCCSRRSKLT